MGSSRRGSSSGGSLCLDNQNFLARLQPGDAFGNVLKSARLGLDEVAMLLLSSKKTIKGPREVEEILDAECHIRSAFKHTKDAVSLLMEFRQPFVHALNDLPGGGFIECSVRARGRGIRKPQIRRIDNAPDN